jgi:hypothetical protein
VVADTLESTPLLATDGNLDGIIDHLDYLVWDNRFGEKLAVNLPGLQQDGDYNRDGTVDGLDYLLWARAYGTSEASAVATQRAALELIFETEGDEDGVLELATAESLSYNNDTFDGVGAAVDSVLEGLVPRLD